MIVLWWTVNSGYHSRNRTFLSKFSLFLASTTRSIYCPNFSHILKHSKSRGDAPIKSLWFKIDSPLTGAWVFGSFLNHYVSRPKKRLTTSVVFCCKLSSIKGLQQPFLLRMFLSLKNDWLPLLYFVVNQAISRSYNNLFYLRCFST